MKWLSLFIFCITLIIVTITLVDAQKKTNQKPNTKRVQKNGNAKSVNTAAKLNNVNGVAKASNKRTTKKPTTKRRKKTTTKPTTKRRRMSTASAMTTVFDENAPDIEAGSDCYDACYPNSTFLTASGSVKDKDQYGTFIEFGGKTYLLGIMPMSWRENWMTCCAIGMQPVIFAESKEVTDFTANTQNNPEVKFWTGGFKHELNNMWSWCTKDSPEPIDNDLMTDVSSNGDNNDLNCIIMTAGAGISTTLTNVFCNITQTKDSEPLNLACESIDKTTNDLVIANPKCTARCNNNRQCKRNETLFKFKSSGELVLEKRYTYGRWVSKCGRYFLFSNGTATFDEARQKCCALGMELLSIKTAAKRKCLAKLTRDYNDISGEFWTSGTDMDCEGNYRWCSVDRAFLKHEINWAAGEPNSNRGHCVTTKTTGQATSTTLQTSECTAKKRYICEVRQSGTTVEAVQKECIALMGLSPQEVDGLNNTNNYTYTMKCYLKCLGDNLGMLINGTLQAGNVMRLMEKSNQQADMDKGYKAIDECKAKSDPNGDECQSAYNMYKCGKEEAPVVFGKMVVYKEVTSEDNNSPIDFTAPRTCYNNMNLKCTLNTTVKALFDKTGATNEGASLAINSSTTWYKSKSGNYTFAAAYIYCCALGMHLPNARTYDEFKTIYDFMDGKNFDNFFDETYTDPNTNQEKWCTNDVILDERMSDNSFKLDKESSFLMSRQGAVYSMYKLRSVSYSLMDRTTVPFIYCQPGEM
ncbi:uncharacterized protein LOC135943983 [Cloeon dipterum]|uniref:uncharacterized protein LOC135943983 n=1 Tax=Cloeon dipterum TaxID=197152 RepID=UPI00321F9AC4